MNKIILHGRLTRDPELKQTQSGVSVCNFTVAVDRWHKSGEDSIADFIDCTAWRGLGDMIGKYFHKGKEILLDGELHIDKWEDNEGNKKSRPKVQVNNVDFCGNKSSNGETNHKPTENITPVLEEIPDDSLPF